MREKRMCILIKWYVYLCTLVDAGVCVCVCVRIGLNIHIYIHMRIILGMCRSINVDASSSVMHIRTCRNISATINIILV